MASDLSNFSRQSIEDRLKAATWFYCVAQYERKEVIPGVTQITFQIGYNTLGHVTFGIQTFGIASLIVANADKEKRLFDTSSGEFIGHDFAEAEKYYNDKFGTLIDDFEIVEMEDVASKLSGLNPSNRNFNLYRTVEKIKDTQNYLSVGNFFKATLTLQSIDLGSLSGRFRSKCNQFKNAAKTCLKLKNRNFQMNQSSFYETLDTIETSCVDNIDQAISKLETINNSEARDLIEQSIKNLKTSKKGIDYLKLGRYEEAKREFDLIDGPFDSYKNYSRMCDVATTVVTNLQNRSTSVLNIGAQLIDYQQLQGDARNEFSTLLNVCKILKDAPNDLETSDDYVQLNAVYKRIFAVEMNAHLKSIFNNKLTAICENLIECIYRNVKDNNYVEAKTNFITCQKMIGEYNLNPLKWPVLDDMYNKLSNAEKYWDEGIELESENRYNETNEKFNAAKIELDTFQQHFGVTTPLFDKIRGKIEGYNLVNRGIYTKCESERYELILAAYIKFKHFAEHREFHNNVALVEGLLNKLEAVKSDRMDSLELDVSLPEVSDHNMDSNYDCSELEKMFFLR